MAESDVTKKRDAFIERLRESTKSTLEMFSIYIGERLGFYRTLSEAGPMTSPELSSRTDTHERYVREWLEQQAVAGILEVEDAKAASTARRYSLSAAHAEVLVDRDSLNYLTPLALLLAGAVRPLESLLEAYRKGGGVPYADYGDDMVKGQEGTNRTMFLQELGKAWLPAIADVHERLLSDPPARVADVGWRCRVVRHRHRAELSESTRGRVRFGRGVGRDRSCQWEGSGPQRASAFSDPRCRGSTTRRSLRLGDRVRMPP